MASLGLRTLDLCRNPIPVLLPPFAALADLEHLHLSAACLSTLDLLEASQKRDICKRLGSSAVEGPEGEDAALEGMKRLETLDLDLNHLTEIPVSLAGATNLGDLSLSRNLISSLQALLHPDPRFRPLAEDALRLPWFDVAFEHCVPIAVPEKASRRLARLV